MAGKGIELTKNPRRRSVALASVICGPRNHAEAIERTKRNADQRRLFNIEPSFRLQARVAKTVCGSFAYRAR
jgi:hypothetical protein